jgi:hypothetical protein
MSQHKLHMWLLLLKIFFINGDQYFNLKWNSIMPY